MRRPQHQAFVVHHPLVVEEGPVFHLGVAADDHAKRPPLQGRHGRWECVNDTAIEQAADQALIRRQPHAERMPQSRHRQLDDKVGGQLVGPAKMVAVRVGDHELGDQIAGCVVSIVKQANPCPFASMTITRPAGETITVVSSCPTFTR